MKVLIIPEDPRLDQHILKPVVERILAGIGRRAQVEVLQDPQMRGASYALNRALIAEIVQDNPMVDLFLLIVDRDGNRDGHVEKAAACERDQPEKLIACLAVEEVEVWMLALFRGELGVSWAEVRAHLDPKEAFAEPLMQRKGWASDVGRGRKRAMRELAGQWQGVLTVCPEIAELRRRVADWVQARA